MNAARQHALPTRYYFHGDEHESEQGRFFCALCDLFFPADHFTRLDPLRRHTPEIHTARLGRSQVSWLKMLRLGRPFVRPDVWRNVLTGCASNAGSVPGQENGGPSDGQTE